MRIPTIIIIIKTSSTGPSGKNKIVYKSLSQSHKHLRHGKLINKQCSNITLMTQQESLIGI